MIDYANIRLIISCSEVEFRKLTLSKWSGQLDIEEAVLMYPHITKVFNELTITIKGKRTIWLTGSLHKAFNNGSNANDFTFSNLHEMIGRICFGLNLDPFKCILQTFEFGVNVILPFKVETILDRLICYKSNPFKAMDGIRSGRYYSAQQYDIKVYDKGKQENLPENILRFEVKSRKAKYIKSNGVELNWLSDLLNKEKLRTLGNHLLACYDNILFRDNSINIKEISKEYKGLMRVGKYSGYWEDQNKKGKRYSKQRKRNKYIELTRKHGTEKYFEIVRELISSKWLELLASELNTCYKLTDFKNQYMLQINSYSKELKRSTDEKRYCLTCGRDISFQNHKSKYCSEKYNGKKGKRCRNKQSNDKHTLSEQVKKILNQSTLFDSIPYLTPTEKQKKLLPKILKELGYKGGKGV